MPLDTELQSALDKLTGETKTIFGDLAGKYSALEQKHGELQRQADALDKKLADRHSTGVDKKSLLDLLRENDSFGRLIADKKGRAILNLSGDSVGLLERKAVLTAGGQGFPTVGVMGSDHDTGITAEARQELTIRAALTARPTTLGMVDFVRVNSPLVSASPMMQTEAMAKFQNNVTFSPASERIRTIATFTPASAQILDDLAELAGFLDTGLQFYVNQEEEIQILSGDATGNNLNGLIPQASAFNTGLLSGSWTRIDIVARAIQQLATAKEFTPTFLVTDPASWWAIRLTKDTLGRYILGDPQNDVAARLFTLQVIPTTNMAAGVFLLGSGNPAATEIRDRMEMQVMVSTEDGTNFQQNLVTVRAEKRMALTTKRPGSFITGSFTQSPA